MLKSSPPFFAHHAHAKNGESVPSEETALLKLRLEPGESIQQSATQALIQLCKKGLERKCISYNRTLMFSTITRDGMGLFGGLYHSIDSLCEYLFFTILKMIIIIKVSS